MNKSVLIQYLRYIKNVRRYSVNTVIAYKSDLLQIQAFFKKNLLDLRTLDIKRFLKRLKQQKASTASANRKLESIKSFFTYCVNNSLISTSPCQTLHQEKMSKAEVEYLSRSKLIPALDSAATSANKKVIRDHLVLELLYFTGARSSEIINIKKIDIDLSNERIKVVGKGRIERFLAINDRIINLIKRFQAVSNSRSCYLLTTDAGRKMYPVFMWRLVRKYLNKKTVGKNLSPHLIRHSAATHLYQNGASMKSVRDFLGHHCYKSTDSYLHFDKETLMTIYQRCHPKGKNG